LILNEIYVFRIFYMKIFSLIKILAPLLLIGIISPTVYGLADTIDVKKNPDTILAGSEINYPPYCIVNENDKADGFSVELLRAAAEAMDLELKFKTGPWKEVKNDLAEGRVDALPLVGRTPEREYTFDFTFPYLTMHGAIVVREGTENIHTIEDLEGKEVAVMAGDNAEEYVNRIKIPMEIITTPTFSNALQHLSEGDYDAVVIQRLLAIQLINQHEIDNLEVAVHPLEDFPQNFCFAVKENNEDLLATLNEGLSIVMADGTFRKLKTKWFTSMGEFRYKNQRIIVSGDHNYPPYDYLDENGQPTGFNTELTKAIAEEMGLNVEIQLQSWAKARKDLKEGNVDVIQGMYYSFDREEEFDLTQGYTQVRHVIVGREKNKLPQNMKELEEYSIIVQKGDIMHDLALKHGYDDQITAVETQNIALKRVSQGRQDIALVAQLQAHYWIDQYGWENLQMSEQSLLSPEYCYAVAEGNQELLGLFSEGLSILKATGEYHEIYNKWLGGYEEPSYTWKDVLTYSLWFIIPAILIILGVLAWSRTLKNTVKKRTNELNKEIEERKKVEHALRQSEEKHKILYEASADAITYIKGNKYIDCNQAVVHMLGCNSKEEIINRMPSDFAPEKQPDGKYSYEKQAEMIQEAMKKGTHRFEWWMKRKDGSLIPLEVQLTLIYDSDGNPIFNSTWRDLSATKKYEQELKESKEKYQKLASELRESNVLFEKAKERAEESDRLKSAFLANMSHEIRTPMNAIVGFSDLLDEETTTEEERQKYVKIIQSRSSDLLTLINDIVDVAKIEVGQIKLNFETVNLNQVLYDLRDYYQKQLKEKTNQVTLKIDPSLPDNEAVMRTDRTRLNQILSNLLNNAVKFTHKGYIELCYEIMGNQQIMFCVKDTGIGIPKDKKHLVFERFRQIEDELADGKFYGGTGLGLNIVKNLVEILGGEIWFDSATANNNENKQSGTTFYFTLPWHQAEEKKAEVIDKDIEARQNWSDKAILIVEDEQANMDFLKAALKSTHAKILSAINGKECLEVMKSTPNISAILMDIKMQTMDGYQTIKKIRETNKEIPVIAQTAYALSGDQKKILATGFNAYLAKPIDKKELITTLSRFIGENNHHTK